MDCTFFLVYWSMLEVQFLTLRHLTPRVRKQKYMILKLSKILLNRISISLRSRYRAAPDLDLAKTGFSPLWMNLYLSIFRSLSRCQLMMFEEEGNQSWIYANSKLLLKWPTSPNQAGFAHLGEGGAIRCWYCFLIENSIWR